MTDATDPTQPVQPIQPDQPAPSGSTFGDPVPDLREDVVRGLVFALGSVVLGAVVTVVLWRLGFIAALSGFVIAGGAVFLYTKGAGTGPRAGLIPLVGLIIVGVLVSFVAIVASDLYDAYDIVVVQAAKDADFAGALPSRWSFIWDNLFNGDVLDYYGKDFALFALFAVLGTFSTLRRLVRTR